MPVILLEVRQPEQAELGSSASSDCRHDLGLLRTLQPCWPHLVSSGAGGNRTPRSTRGAKRGPHALPAGMDTAGSLWDPAVSLLGMHPQNGKELFKQKPASFTIVRSHTERGHFCEHLAQLFVSLVAGWPRHPSARICNVAILVTLPS